MPFFQAVSPSTPADPARPAPPDDNTQIEKPRPEAVPHAPAEVKAGSNDPARNDDPALPASSKKSSSAIPGSGSPNEGHGSNRPDQVDGNSAKIPKQAETPGGSHSTDELGSDEPIGQGLQEGRVLFKKYVLKKKLGSGGMGEVWLVHHIELDCPRALKFIRTGLAQSPDLKRRFRREARVMARVQHPNAVEIHDAFTAGGLAFIEMAYVSGKSLVDVLKHGQPMALDWTARILEQLSEVLAVAHEAGIVHRDLKPANLMLLGDRAPGREFLKVLDFGIAKLLRMEEADGASITHNAPLGTYPYMSPEQFGYGTAPVDQRSDIYTVGIILFEFLTGFRPYSLPNHNLYQWLQKHVFDPIPFFHDRNPSVEFPVAVEQVVRRCLSKLPDDRPQSAQALCEEFLEAAELVRPPSRSGGSSIYFTPVVVPTAPESSTPPSGPNPAIEKVAVEPEKPPGEIKPVVLEPEPSQVGEKGDPSTLSDSNEWQSPDTFEIESISVIDNPSINRDETELVIVPPVATSQVTLRRLFRLRNWVAAVSMFGIFGFTAAAFVASLSKKVEEYKKPSIESAGETPNPPPPPPPSPSFPLVSSGHRWKSVLYNLYGKSAYLPQGHKPQAGTTEAEDGWPRVIEREVDGVQFIRIAGGSFLKGKPQLFADHPKDEQALVTIKGFYLQKFEVTNKEINDFYKKGQDPNLADEYADWRASFDPDKIDPVRIGEKQRLPAVFLSWKNADRYARSVSGKLPSWEQWEFAASSRGERLNFVWDENLSDEDKKLICIHQRDGSREVGKSSNDKTKQNVYDMGGNVREWCQFGEDAQTEAWGGCYDDSFDVDQCGIKAHQSARASREVGFRVLLECPILEELNRP